MSTVCVIPSTDKNNKDLNAPTSMDQNSGGKHDDDEQNVVLKTRRQDGDDEDEYDGEEELHIAVYRLPESHDFQFIKVVPLPHARSEIWSYFGFLADDSGEIQDRKKVVCKVCGTTLSYSGNTTNLFTHLKSMHPEANPQKMPPTNKTPWKGKRTRKRVLIDQAMNNKCRIVVPDHKVSGMNAPGTETDGLTSFKRVPIIISKATVPTRTTSARENQPSKTCPSSDAITDAIVNVIVQDFRPVSLVEGKGFQALLKLIVPAYQLPDTQELSLLAERKIEAMKRDLLC